MSVTFYDLAKQIPTGHRADILINNHIWKALPKDSDLDMKILFVYYINYIEPGNEMYRYEHGMIVDACQKCLTNILDKFKLLEPYLILLEKETKLLES